MSYDHEKPSELMSALKVPLFDGSILLAFKISSNESSIVLLPTITGISLGLLM